MLSNNNIIVKLPGSNNSVKLDAVKFFNLLNDKELNKLILSKSIDLKNMN